MGIRILFRWLFRNAPNSQETAGIAVATMPLNTYSTAFAHSVYSFSDESFENMLNFTRENVRIDEVLVVTTTKPKQVSRGFVFEQVSHVPLPTGPDHCSRPRARYTLSRLTRSCSTPSPFSPQTHLIATLTFISWASMSREFGSGSGAA